MQLTKRHWMAFISLTCLSLVLGAKVKGHFDGNAHLGKATPIRVTLNQEKPDMSQILPTQTRSNTSLWDRFTVIPYGADPKQTLYLAKPEASNPPAKFPLVLLVHGGNYLSGSATDDSMQVLASYFLKRGFAVASIDYRTLQQNHWPASVTDVQKGIEKTQEMVGAQVSDMTYVGYSAGAVTGALLLYSNHFATPPNIHRFIGISGLYDKSAVSPDPIEAIQDQSLDHVNLLHIVDEIHDVKTQTPALLIEGAQDYFADKYPYTKRSHAAQLQRLLKHHRTPAFTYWATEPNYNTHEGPISLFALPDAKLSAAIDKFMAI